MATERRVARLAEQIHHRAAEIIAHELKDPRMGFVTVTRVVLDQELEHCKGYWSCLVIDKERSLTAHADHRPGQGDLQVIDPVSDKEGRGGVRVLRLRGTHVLVDDGCDGGDGDLARLVVVGAAVGEGGYCGLS